MSDRPKIMFVATILVTDGPLCRQRAIRAESDLAEEAMRHCLEKAVAMGWTPPTRWQWWRHRDSTAPSVTTIV